MSRTTSEATEGDAQRPWPVPRRPWVIAQTWRDLLFAHWPVALGELRARVPAVLPIDTFEGQAWLGIVPFAITGVRPRFAPPVPLLSSFLELNVRTYVTLGGKPGVFFFSLDAGSMLAVMYARLGYHLPYFYARMRSTHAGSSVRYESRRATVAGGRAEFQASYRPSGDITRAKPGTLEEWLTARFCFYCLDRQGAVYRGEIDHQPWRLQPADAAIRVNTMADAAGLRLADRPPLLHFSRRLDAQFWPIERVGRNG